MDRHLDPRLRAIHGVLHDDSTANPFELPTDRPPKDGDDADRIRAAVALVLRPGKELEFLLVKRATHERDPWSGQMALPGGRWERSDDGLLHTAQRETLEETGLDLRSFGTPIGRLGDVTTSSPRIPKMRIAAFTFAVPPGTPAKVASRELDAVHWVSVDLLRAPETASEFKLEQPGHRVRFPSYHVVGEHVWGLTYRILSGFIEHFEDE